MRGDQRRRTADPHVGITIRTRTFFTQVKTEQNSPRPRSIPDVVAAGAHGVLARFQITRPVRLIGVRLDLASPVD